MTKREFCRSVLLKSYKDLSEEADFADISHYLVSAELLSIELKEKVFKAWKDEGKKFANQIFLDDLLKNCTEDSIRRLATVLTELGDKHTRHVLGRMGRSILKELQSYEYTPSEDSDSVELPVKHGRLKRSNSSVSIDVRKMEVNLKWASKPKKWFKKVGRKFSVGKTKENQTKVPSTKNLSQQQEGDVESNNLEESYYNESAIYMQLSKVDNEETDLSSNPLKSLSGQEEEINEPLSHGKEDKMQLIMSQLVAQSTDIKEFRQIVIKSFCDLQKGVDEVTLKGSNIEVLQLKQQLADEKANFTQELQKQEELQRSTNQVSVDLKEKTIFLEAKAKEKESEILQLKQQLADEKANFTHELQKNEELQRSTNQVTVYLKEKTTLFEAKAKEKESEILRLKQQLADEKANFTQELQKYEELQWSPNQVTVDLKEKTIFLEAKVKEKESEILQLKQQLADEKANFTQELQKQEELQRSTNQVTVVLKEKTTLFEAKAKEKESEILQLKQQLADEKANFTHELQKNEELQRSVHGNQVTVDLKEKTTSLEARTKDKESEILQDQLKQQHAAKNTKTSAKALSGCSYGKCGERFQSKALLQAHKRACDGDLQASFDRIDHKRASTLPKLSPEASEQSPENVDLTNKETRNYLPRRGAFKQEVAESPNKADGPFFCDKCGMNFPVKRTLWHHWESCQSGNQAPYDSTSKVKTTKKAVTLPSSSQSGFTLDLQLRQQLADEIANFTSKLQKNEELQKGSVNQVTVDLQEKTTSLEARTKDKESEILQDQLKQQHAAKNTKTSAKALSGCSCGKCGERFQSKALLQAHKRACDGGLQTSFDRIDYKRASTLPKLSPEASEQSPENVDLINKETRNCLPRREAFKQEVAKSPNKADGPYFCDKCGMDFLVKKTLWHHWESCQSGKQAPYDSTSKIKTTKKAVTLPRSGTAQNQRLDDKSHENTAENPHCEICNKEFTWDQRLELWDHREKCKKQ